MKQYTSKRSVQILAHLLTQYGISNIVISPGSRNAPLAIHFTEFDEFNCYSIVDERSAGFVALGMAKSQKKPVAVSCTSGSAAVNYYPAVVEAFYQNIPLLILTADRPSDYTDIFDGQTIRQEELFHQHSYGDFQLLEDSKENADEINFNSIKRAIELCIEKQGPVHINIPLEEPLYELVPELPVMPSVEKTIPKKKYEIPGRLVATWNTAKKIMILVGTMDKNPKLEICLFQLAKNNNAVILTESNSNLYNEKFFNHIDRYIFNFSEKEFQNYAPDLLITIGQNVVSKKIKQLLRKTLIPNHWHIDPYWHPDTYFALSEKIPAKADEFLPQFIQKIKIKPQPYFTLWESLKDKIDRKHRDYCIQAPFSDFKAFEIISNYIPEQYDIHFSNSSSIRYAQLFNFSEKNKVYCNRGTSGIDGCTSTAMGYAIANENPTLLITGDISFFYDINGLWNQYIPPYTRIILLNNGEGNIFRIIPGPNTTNAVDEFIATEHAKNAETLAKHFGFNYFRAEDLPSLERSIENFFKPEHKPKILEVYTKNCPNADTLKNYFQAMKLNSEN
ncbi:2-succinyl-5-enolpyruvyl-6-hydroxy-3-cyclohexene-1-carboxylic-acid synthase [Riemerella columbipharyngis]|uniref:2-succinyl-5-enolpyruvyl-6-hydroxy-3-cyclohexene-1-carboxylate synthase n=1 Tax=Riemerella columbipharyngis TaxID=1071918 RepID=A0A1G7DFY8_9FLAO|nr:2-succinyl-5-enolpyruvyl-6-hydroxy-3-cyclohexene-1-carboxylic-acid synthase [Riemerella columbipharyngis]SDE50443.1 2-succinyl-5-enolpyruvyl-6-hydroxy-3-cyclohexene-1-carboxylate synthase [Riemerella columbipharyngis]